MRVRSTLTALALTLTVGIAGAQSLVITEVMYNPPEGGVDSLEFIEIYNPGTTAVDVANYTLSVGGVNALDTLKGSLAPKSFYVSTVNARAFETIYKVKPTSQWSGGGLFNGGNREVKLQDATGATVVAFTYLNSAPWPAISGSNGPSIELCGLSADPTQGGNWLASTVKVGVMVNNQELLASPFEFTPGNCGGVAARFPVRTIASLRANNAAGVARLNDSLATVTGLAVGINLRRGRGLQFTLIDANNTAGIGVFLANDSLGYAIREGDRLEIAGRIGQFNGLTQIEPSSIKRLSNTTNLPDPTPVTRLDESTESRLVSIVGRIVDFDGYQPMSDRSYNLKVLTAPGDTAIVRLAGVNRVQLPVGGGTSLRFTGIGNQFDDSSPFTSGYQLLPRRTGDISPLSAVREVAAEEVFAVSRTGRAIQLRLFQPTTAVTLYDALGRRVAFAKTGGLDRYTFEDTSVGAGLLIVRAVLPTGEQATQIVVRY